MTDQKKYIPNEQLTQKDIVQLLLHNAQHMATREEVRADINELKIEVKADIKELKDELKADAKRWVYSRHQRAQR